MRTTRTFSAFLSSGSASKAALAASRPPSQPTTISFSEMRASPLIGQHHHWAAHRHHHLLHEIALDARDLVGVGGRHHQKIRAASGGDHLIGDHRRPRIEQVEIMRQGLAPHCILEGLLHALRIVLEEAAVALEDLGCRLEADGRIDLHGRHDIEPGNMRTRLAGQVHGRRHEFAKPADLVQ
jgi:hypothetical protein